MTSCGHWSSKTRASFAFLALIACSFHHGISSSAGITDHAVEIAGVTAASSLGGAERLLVVVHHQDRRGIASGPVRPTLEGRGLVRVLNIDFDRASALGYDLIVPCDRRPSVVGSERAAVQAAARAAIRSVGACIAISTVACFTLGMPS